MNKLIGAYTNGNYQVAIFEDGTKIRSNDIEPTEGQSPDECFIAEFPESIDVTITHRCNAGCEMCYAGCTMHGENADIMNAKWIDGLKPYTEMAIGGGNIFEHPDLIPFLEKLSARKVFANITVNQRHFMDRYNDIVYMINTGLVKGVGVSVFNPTDELLDAMAGIENAVAHCILGVVTLNEIVKMYDRDMRVLLLGYKTTGRGEAYSFKHYSDIGNNIAEIDRSISDLVKHFKVVSFDNLALKQLNIKDMLTTEEWNRFYMGDDGVDGKTTSATMFIDMVDEVFAINSMEHVRYSIKEGDTPESMYQFLRKELA